jgi:hypothetical protein
MASAGPSHCATARSGGANQTLQTIGGNETLLGSTSFGDIFLGKAAGLVGDQSKRREQVAAPKAFPRRS